MQIRFSNHVITEGIETATANTTIGNQLLPKYWRDKFNGAISRWREV